VRRGVARRVKENGAAHECGVWQCLCDEGGEAAGREGTTASPDHVEPAARPGVRPGRKGESKGRRIITSAAGVQATRV